MKAEAITNHNLANGSKCIYLCTHVPCTEGNNNSTRYSNNSSTQVLHAQLWGNELKKVKK